MARRARAVIAAAAVACLAALAAAGPAGAAELPTCAEGPERVGDEIIGTPCNDRIVAPPSVSRVDGGPGNDVIIGANSAAVPASTISPATGGIHLEVGSQTFNGGEGNDIVYGDRGNDTLRGNGGDDRLYGGIGDDVLEGGAGNDFLSGGFGADKIDGQEGSDFVRGDATVDEIFDSGLIGEDTLSFATGVTPGFFDENQGRGYPKFSEYSGLPKLNEEGRGVFVNLAGGYADNNVPAAGGGIDKIEGSKFERIIGSPFADFIIGTTAAQTIYGGGGGDVILGGGGLDTLIGGAGGDYLEGEAGSTSDGGPGDNCVGVTPEKGGCGSAKAVTQKAPAKISVGMLDAGGNAALYVIGSNAADKIAASGSGTSVTVTATGGPIELGEGCTGSGPVTCTSVSPLDSVLLAGGAGNDEITEAFPDGVSVYEIGNAGEDLLVGGEGEDALVDGSGASADTLFAEGGDDALVHNLGPDRLDGGQGSDLLISAAALCQGETILGGEERPNAPTPDRDNASWAPFTGEGVDAQLNSGLVGKVGANEAPECPPNLFDHMEGIEDLEGSNQSDTLVGNEGDNQLLGHKGSDTYFALGGNDSILANAGTVDRIINCGPGPLDQAVIDERSKAIDPTPIECERVREGAPNEFAELPLLSEPAPPAPAPLPPPKDRTPPRTKLLRHPGKTVRVLAGKRKLVAFRFAASEKGSSFKCRLDRKPYASCRSPRKYRVAVGRHVFRAFAIDAAGNRDRSPSVFQFRVVAVKRHAATRAPGTSR